MFIYYLFIIYLLFQRLKDQLTLSLLELVKNESEYELILTEPEGLRVFFYFIFLCTHTRMLMLHL